MWYRYHLVTGDFLLWGTGTGLPGTGMDQKIIFLGRFFGEKLVFGGVGKDFRVEKSEVKKLEKNRQFFR